MNQSRITLTFDGDVSADSAKALVESAEYGDLQLRVATVETLGLANSLAIIHDTRMTPEEEYVHVMEAGVQAGTVRKTIGKDGAVAYEEIAV